MSAPNTTAIAKTNSKPLSKLLQAKKLDDIYRDLPYCCKKNETYRFTGELENGIPDFRLGRALHSKHPLDFFYQAVQEFILDEIQKKTNECYNSILIPKEKISIKNSEYYFDFTHVRLVEIGAANVSKVRILYELQHINICEIYGFVLKDNTAFIVLPYYPTMMEFMANHVITFQQIVKWIRDFVRVSYFLCKQYSLKPIFSIDKAFIDMSADSNPLKLLLYGNFVSDGYHTLDKEISKIRQLYDINNDDFRVLDEILESISQVDADDIDYKVILSRLNQLIA